MLTLSFLTADAPRSPVVAVEQIAATLCRDVNQRPELLTAIETAHVDRADGTHIQAVLTPMLTQLGFEFEKKGLFSDVEVPGLRPDLFHQGLGIIGEFERGGTLTNNRDLLDFYKVHVCERANHLFLFVPQRIHGRSASVASTNRMQAVIRQQSGVDSVAVFGY